MVFTAQVEDGDVQESFFDEVKDVQDTAGAPISVVKRVYGFEAVVDESHFNERIHIEEVGLVHELFELAHEGEDRGVILRRGVDDVPMVVFERGARKAAKTGVVLFQLGLNHEHVVVSEELAFPDKVESFPEKLAIAEDFLCGRFESFEG